MGEVYEAAHVRLPGRFAVKILRPDLLTNQEAVKRFCREAEIMSELRHPHIIQIFDFNTSSDGLPYFVMEYLDGVDLQMRLTQTGALPMVDLVRIVDAVASALGVAHAMGVVHRDLKPANIFLLRGERQDADFVKVIDFGISKAAGAGPGLSIPSGIMGTPAFMAPEQALGLLGKIDACSDQFALAAITYLMLTGREPFVGNDPVSLLYQVVHEQPPRLSELLPWDVRQIQAVLDKAMAKRPEDRFDTIVAFSLALASAAEALIELPAPVHALRLVPKAPVPPMLDEDEAPPPIKPAAARLPVVRPSEAVADSELPRSLDRVPHGPQRAVVLGLAVLGLAAVIVHKDWYRGLPRHAARFEQAFVGLAHRGWRAPPAYPATPIAEPTQIANVSN
jgi:serine/threonine protein kinase